jgi:hypothetical protein
MRKKAIVGLGGLKRDMLSVASRMILSVITHLLTEKQELVALPEGRRYITSTHGSKPSHFTYRNSFLESPEDI